MGDSDATGKKEVFIGTPGWFALFGFTTTKHIPLLVSAIVLAVASGIVPPALAIILGKIFELFTDIGSGQIIGSTFKYDISKYCVYLVTLGLVSWILNSAFFLLWLVFGDIQATSCRNRIFVGLLGKSVMWYDMRRNGIGVVLSRMQTEVRDLQIAVSQPLGFLFQYTTTAVAASGLALYYSWSLTLVTLAAVPLSATVISFMSRRMQLIISAENQQLSIASMHTLNAFINIETVKCFNGQETELKKFSSAIKLAARYYRKQAFTNAMQIGLVRLMTLCMFVQGFWYGSHLVFTESRSAGMVITTFWACLQAMQAVEQILPQMLVLEKGRAAGRALRTFVLDSRLSTMTRSPAGIVLESCSGDVEFRNVSFIYPMRPMQRVLDHINCFFAAGETTFIIGASGSGKSTLGQLLVRFCAPLEGSILVDGIDIDLIDHHWLRSQITLVEQNTTLFQGSILENIAIESEDFARLSSEDVKQALDFALLQQTITDMPQGLLTFIESRGKLLSGGQKQRIALARARFRDTPILILDESTSALDQISKSLIMTAIRHWRRGKTTIIISHDTSQVQDGDYVYILRRGCITQEGFRGSLGEELDPADPNDKLDHLPENPMQPVSPLRVAFGATGRNRWSVDSLFSSSMVDASVSSTNVFDPMDSPIAEESNFGMPFIPSAFVCCDLAINSPRYLMCGRPELSPIRRATETSHAVSSFEHDHLANSKFTNPQYNLPVPQPIIQRPSDGAVELMESAGISAVHHRSTLITNLVVSPRQDGHQPPSSPAGTLLVAQNGLQMPSSTKEYTLFWILSTVWPSLSFKSRCRLLVGSVSAAIHSIATPVFSWVLSKLLATFYMPENQSQEALKWSVSIFAIALVDAVSSVLMHTMLERCGQEWINATRVDAMKRILSQPQYFFSRKRNNAHQLTEILDRNAQEMRNLLGRFAAYGFIALTMLTIAITWSMAVSWRLSLVALATVPIIYGFARSFEAVSLHFETRINNAGEVASFVMSETFTNIRTIRSFNLEARFHKRHREATLRVLKLGIRRASCSSVFFGASDSAILLVQALVFYYGSILVSSNLYSAQEVLQVLSILLFTLANVNAIIASIPQIDSSRSSASRLLRLSNMPLVSRECLGSIRIQTIGDITMNEMSFNYPNKPGKAVLNAVSLNIPRGSSVAIVGPSGSGKSTIGSLLVKLYATTETESMTSPQICLGGIDIARIDTPTLRDLIALVQQHPVIFPLTVRENISYGLFEGPVKVLPSEISDAAKAADIHDFIMSLPYGYETRVGEGGTGLSGGQAQRIALARALARKPQVLILDEPTSALDADSASLVRQSMQRMIHQNIDMTIVIITHHEDMMKVADKIVMLDNGQIVEKGSFGELMSRKGHFSKLLSGGLWEIRDIERSATRPTAEVDGGNLVAENDLW